MFLTQQRVFCYYHVKVQFFRSWTFNFDTRRLFLIFLFVRFFYHACNNDRANLFAGKELFYNIYTEIFCAKNSIETGHLGVDCNVVFHFII